MVKQTKTKVEGKKEIKIKGENPMRKMILEKVILNCGGTDDKFDRGLKLLQILTERKIKEVTSTKRIPSFGVRPGLKTGSMVTLRGEAAAKLLKRLLGAVENKLSPKQIADNHFSFGIEEYLEIPDMEYQRDIGVLGMDVTAVFKRAGKRVGQKKIKSGKVPKKQNITKQEIIDYLTKLGITIE